MKIGVRKPSIKKSLKARTTGKIERSIKKSINPIYGNKGMGFAKNPTKSINNSIYHKTTIGVSDILHSSLNSSSNTRNTNDNFNSFKATPTNKSKISKSNKLKIILVILILLLFLFIRAIFLELNKTLNNNDIEQIIERNTSEEIQNVAPNIINNTQSSILEQTETESIIEQNKNEIIETYILNTNTKKFHKSYCSGTKQIKSSNYSEIKSTRDEIISKGYSPCGKCNP